MPMDDKPIADTMSAMSRPQHLAPVPPVPPPSYESDEELIGAVLEGDARAAGQFHDRLRPVIEHALRRILRGRRDEFDDLVQITFERVVRGLAEDRFEGRCHLTTWAGAIAGHVALDALRRRLRDEQRVVRESRPDQRRSAASPIDQIEARAELERLHDILIRMKPNLAEALILHDVLGHALPEVAQLTRATLSAAQSRLFRARKELLRRARANIGAGGRP
jgi:RNA polymerase sigma factor (sigma-70 family)